MEYKSHFTGHDRAQRKAVVQMGLVTESELAYLDSDYMIFFDGEDYTFLHMDYAKHLIHINR